MKAQPRRSERGEGTGGVTATGRRTYFGRTTQLVQTARPRLHVQDVITRIVRWLLVIVGVLVALTAVGALVEGLPMPEVLPMSLVLLMSAIPVALPVMFTVSTAVGAHELGRLGVLITRLSAVEDAATMDMLCADKTGTLTRNELVLVGVVPRAGASEAEVIDAGAPPRARRTPIRSMSRSCARRPSAGCPGQPRPSRSRRSRP